MLSSMTPTIILKDEKPFMVIGTPGGSTIITQVLQVIMNVIDFGMNIYDAINSPRIHHQWLPDEIDYEEHGITEDVKQNLLKRGHKFGAMEPLGLMEGIIINQNEKVFYGTSDTRAYGKAMGY
jgi:gamma-glutamyltranspeptidase/glutathione hydrolase